MFCVCFINEVSISLSLMALPKLSLSGFQNQMLWELIFPVQESLATDPNLELRTFIAVGDPLQYNYSPVCGSFPGGISGKEPACQWDLSSIPKEGYPFQYSYLENLMNRGAWRAAKSWTWLKQLGRGGVMGLEYVRSLTLLPISLWFLLHVFCCRDIFLIGSTLFHQWLFCR